MVFVFVEEGINIKFFGEVEWIIDFLKGSFLLIKDDSVDLEKEGFGCLLDPSTFFNSYNLAFFISVVIDVRNNNFFESLIKFLVFNIDEKQTEELFLLFVELNYEKFTFRF